MADPRQVPVPAADEPTPDGPTVPATEAGPDERPAFKMRLFGSQQFFQLWLTQVASSIGDWLGFLAIAALATRINPGSPEAAVGVVMSARIVPGFFLGAASGVVADRFDRKKVMVWCNVGRAAVLVTLPFVDTILGLVAASLVLECFTLLWTPAKEASVPNLVPPGHLTTANSLSGIPLPLRDRKPGALAEAARRLAAPIRELARQQWRFDLQWQALREYATSRGVHLFGDLPIYVAPDSVATWVFRDQFQLDVNGAPKAVSGVPPDYFAEDGQLWGNPLYDFETQRRDVFRFWVLRLGLQAERFDVLRIDHFRALEAYWEIPASARTAREGRWRKAPGEALLATMRRELPQLELVAEDLGLITDEVIELRKAFALPGMRVLQFAFDGDGRNPHLPHMHEPDLVAYTGTHDNDTTAGWYAALGAKQRDQVRRFLARADHEVVHALMRQALASVARMAVLPAQDLLQLGSEARLNRPGTAKGNWSWQLPLEALTPELAAYFCELNQLYGRSG